MKRCHNFLILPLILAFVMIATAPAQSPAESDSPAWLPVRKTREQITPEEWEGMKRITAAFPAPEEAHGVSGKYFARYGGKSEKPPQTWAELTEEQIAAGATRNLSMFGQLGKIVHHDPSEEGRAKAKVLFIECARCFIDAEENSAGGTTYMVERTGLEGNILAMRNVLKEGGIYDDLTRAWMMADRFMLAERPSLNMDWCAKRVPLSWALVANMDDSPEKLHRLRLLQRATSLALAQLFTPDGGGMHHNCDHISYASYSTLPIVELVAKVHRTPFRLDARTIKHIRAFARVHALASIELVMPGNLAARANLAGEQFRTLPNILLALARMADPVEPEMAGFVLGIKGRHEDWKEGFMKEHPETGPADIRGHHSYNVSAAAIHRRGDWLVSIDGARAGNRGIEMYCRPGWAASYMRNSCFGSVQVLRRGVFKWRGRRDLDASGQGYMSDGWDFNHFAGVTAPVLPNEVLMSNKEPSYVHNGSPFAGGTSLGEDGIWGMIVKPDHLKQETCRKSAFCFDNRITLLTSDIRSVAIDYPKPNTVCPVHTTVFQFALDSRDKPTFLNDQRVTQFPFETRIPLTDPVRMKDHMGNGYVVHAADGGTLHVARRTQESEYFTLREPRKNARPDAQSRGAELLAPADGGERPLQLDEPGQAPLAAYLAAKDLMSRKSLNAEQKRRILDCCEPTPGDFVIACIEHDCQSKSRGAAFTLFVQGEPSAGALPYEILRQDNVAHAFVDKPNRTTGYVVFEGDEPLGVGLLHAVSRPALVMLRENADGNIACSVSSTDVENAAPIVLRLAGAWSIGDSARRDIACQPGDEATTVTVPYKDYMPVRFSMVAN